MSTYQTCNPRAVHNTIRSVPLFRPAAMVFGPSKADYLVGDLRRALDARQGWADQYTAARLKLGKANRTRAEYRRANQADAMRALNQVRAAMRANERAVKAAEAALLALGVSLPAAA